MAINKPIWKTETVVKFLEEGLLTFTDWRILVHIYKTNKYIVLYDLKEHIFVNPAAENSTQILEIVPVILKQKTLNRKTEKLFGEFEKLTDKETGDCLLRIWYDWRKKARKIELHIQAENIIKRMRSKRLSYKARRNREIIRELFDIGFRVYDEETKADWQKGAENAFMYGYLLGMEECSKSSSGQGS